MPRRPVTFPHLDPAECVAAPSGKSFHCPDISTTDGHLKSLWKKMRKPGEDSAQHREDFEALLDRRFYLKLMASR